MRPSDLQQEVLEKFKKKNTWTHQVEVILDSWCRINRDMEISILRARDFALEILLEERREHKTGNGVFMGTVHSVKGMQFPYVFILDGGWESNNIEEERRLFYVGMTRAEERLCLCHIKNSLNPHIMSLKENSFIYETAAKTSGIKGFSKDLTVSILGMEDLYISYPGLFPEGHAIHRNLKELETGDKVRLKEKKTGLYIVNDKNQVVAALSKKGSAKWRHNTHNILNARVLGIIRRRPPDDEKETKYQNLKMESWELPIVEVLHKKHLRQHAGGQA
ncbi:MAG: ATP-binding domain-containing protein [Deltaproteobacteria bacterium]|nr:ATP-binding domain-containing protein [Deltaproteobacteria bacterium]